MPQAVCRQKSKYDAKQNLNMYKPGDPVWLLNESRTIAVSPKLQAAYDGPYVIAACLSNLDFRVQKDKDGRKSVVIHHDKLKLCLFPLQFKSSIPEMAGHRGRIYECIECGFREERCRVSSHVHVPCPLEYGPVLLHPVCI